MMSHARPTLTDALIGGAVGATVLTLIHETARRTIPEAPRMDSLGRKALARGLESVGVEPPRGDSLQAAALAGDLVSNTLYYALAGLGPTDDAIERGGILGAVAGIGGIALPPLMGLGHHDSMKTPARAAMTLGWYLTGGLVAGVAISLLSRRHS
jgi:hypothetical protein